MKQTPKRILSLVLSFVMLMSVFTVYTSAIGAYVPDESYYQQIHLDSPIVNPEWAGKKAGDQIQYIFRGKTITQNFDESKHFASIQDAYDYCINNNQTSITIVLAAGLFTEPTEISNSVTFVGANGGINPVVNNGKNVWTKSNKRNENESTIMSPIFVDVSCKKNIDVTFDGVKFKNTGAFIDARSKELKSTVTCTNSIIDNALSGRYEDLYSYTCVFSFESSLKLETTVNINNTWIENMNSNVIGANTTKINAENVMFTNSGGSFIASADAPKNQNAEYDIKNCMFYNNALSYAAISIDHSKNDNTNRDRTNLDITNCVFLDGPYTSTNPEFTSISPIKVVVAGVKNEINIQNNYFKGIENYEVPAFDITFTGATLTAEIKDSIVFSNNILHGFCHLPNTYGIVVTSKVDFSNNYFANSYGEQADPIYKHSASRSNVVVEPYYVDPNFKYQNTLFTLKSFGIAGARVDHIDKTIYATVDYGKVINLGFVANDKNSYFELYDLNGNKLNQLNTSNFVSGVDKNVFVLKGKSNLYPAYNTEYKVYLSTFNPSLAIDFTAPNTYLVSASVANYKNGDAFYSNWDNTLYKFIVGKNAFATTNDVFALGTQVPTIIFPAGTVEGNISIPRSAILLGAKHGINPNIQDFDNPDKEWAINPDRSNYDQETVIKNSVIAFEPTQSGQTIELDGFTFGNLSGFADRVPTENFYTTSIVKNIIVDEAGGATYHPVGADMPFTLPSVMCVGSEKGVDSTTNYKSAVFVNFRMENQNKKVLFSNYFENLVLDGIYCANNQSAPLFVNEITSPKDQNFNFELVNSFFYKNAALSGGYYFIVNHVATRTEARQYSKFRMDNCMFYNNTTYSPGIFGIKFSGNIDRNEFTNNIFISKTSYSFFPGGTGWFQGYAGSKNNANLNNLEIIDQDNFVFKYNVVMCGRNDLPSAVCTNPKNVFDYNYNLFTNTIDKKSTDISQTLNESSLDSRYKADIYFRDWDMTIPSTNETNVSISYTIDGPGVLNNNVYTEQVSKSATHYDLSKIISVTSSFPYVTPEQDNITETVSPKTSNYVVYDKYGNEVDDVVNIQAGVNEYTVDTYDYSKNKTNSFKIVLVKNDSTELALKTFGNWQITGNSIYACTNNGNFVIPTAVASTGATVTIYDDIYCTAPYTRSIISGIGSTPVIKYVKVANATSSRVYTLSIVKSLNSQAELVAVNNATKVSATEFVADSMSTEFSLVPQYSDYAQISVVVDGIKLNPTVTKGYDEYIVSGIVKTKKAYITITSQTGATKQFTVTINRAFSSCNVSDIRFMRAKNDHTFDAITSGVTFNVKPILECDDATYQVYADKNCTTPLENNTMLLTKRNNVAYLKVTSYDKTSSKIITLNVVSTLYQELIETAGKTQWELKVNGQTITATNQNCYTVTVPNGATEFKLEIKSKTVKYEPTVYLLFADSAYQIPLSEEFNDEIKSTDYSILPVSGRNTTYYVRIHNRYNNDDAEDVTTSLDYIKLTVVSAQKSYTYNDSAKIANWAKFYVNELNSRGYGYFIGDNKGNFNANAGITRFEVAAVVTRLLGFNTSSYTGVSNPYKDTIPNWALPYVKVCYVNGIMQGKGDNVFDGNAKTTRQEFARLISHAITLSKGLTTPVDELYKQNAALIDHHFNAQNFADANTLAAWAVPGIKLATSYYSIMKGSEDENGLNINATKPITRQEVATLIARYEGIEK